MQLRDHSASSHPTLPTARSTPCTRTPAPMNAIEVATLEEVTKDDERPAEQDQVDGLTAVASGGSPEAQKEMADWLTARLSVESIPVRRASMPCPSARGESTRCIHPFALAWLSRCCRWLCAALYSRVPLATSHRRSSSRHFAS